VYLIIEFAEHGSLRLVISAIVNESRLTVSNWGRNGSKKTFEIFDQFIVHFLFVVIIIIVVVIIIIIIVITIFLVDVSIFVVRFDDWFV
jgi:hypothetical protein